MTVAVLHDGNDVAILGSRTLPEKLDIDAREGLKEKDFRLQNARNNYQVAIYAGGGTGEDASDRHVSVPLSVLQRIANHEKAVPEEAENLKEAPLARGAAMLMKPDSEHILSVEASTEALDRAPQ